MLKFFRFLWTVSRPATRSVLIYATLSGVLETAAVVTAVWGATVGVVGGVALPPLVGFLSCATLFVIFSRLAQKSAADLVERTVADIRLETTDRLRRTGFAAFEAVGAARISTALTKDVRKISAAAEVVTLAFSAAVIALCTLLFIAYLSLAALLVVCVLLLAGLSRYFVGMAGLLKRMGAAALVELQLFESLEHLLKGFKELKMNAGKAADLFTNYFSRLALNVEERLVSVGNEYIDTHLMLLTACLLSMGAVVFILPRYATVSTLVVYEVAVLLVFMLRPLQRVVLVLPVLDKAGTAIDGLQALMKDLESLDVEPVQTSGAFRGFREITFTDVVFEYLGPDRTPTFRVGPINLSIRPGELLFIVGGNGSGKTTFVRLLTGLIVPVSGEIRVDGVAVGPSNRQDYRALFGAVYTDYHLFDRLYGLPAIDPNRVAQLLHTMQLDWKTHLELDRFSTTDLSHGQRRRLALTAALLEDKPVYMFDEFAVDQEPGFRRFLYEDLLKDMQRHGKTIVAVTHDDRYFASADRVLTMADGLFLRDDRRGKPA